MTLPLDSFSRCCCRGCRSASDVTTFPSRLSYLSSHFIIPLHQALPSHHLLYAECPRMSLVPLRLDGLLFVSRLILLVWFVSWCDCYLARPPALHPPSSSPILYSPASRKLGASNLCVNTITPFRDTRLLGFEHTLLDNFRDAKIVGHLPDRSLKRAIPCIVRCPSIHHAMVTLDLAAGSDTHGQRGSCPLS